MMKNIKLTAFDMDGTLLNDRKELPPDFPADASIILFGIIWES